LPGVSGIFPRISFLCVRIQTEKADENENGGQKPVPMRSINFPADFIIKQYFIRLLT
jgi:hypothetical protein